MLVYLTLNQGDFNGSHMSIQQIRRAFHAKPQRDSSNGITESSFHDQPNCKYKPALLAPNIGHESNSTTTQQSTQTHSINQAINTSCVDLAGKAQLKRKLATATCNQLTGFPLLDRLVLHTKGHIHAFIAEKFDVTVKHIIAIKHGTTKA